ncbi:hypothetical protein [Bifidobacterium sp. ESL0745]|uniref:hypothetical protein n=1 Tax=Bifidobacterium sp. ESL0745 TaxID=2983226 RepID=UPI0023F749A5|nr:hypothetical protein [Bifidobacterium sp. ESL0745]MDF7665718.1 hypothetical protein [Bifidobacterium sp. ESL0745]
MLQIEYTGSLISGGTKTDTVEGDSWQADTDTLTVYRDGQPSASYNHWCSVKQVSTDSAASVPAATKPDTQPAQSEALAA